jgi:hypothetical protein
VVKRASAACRARSLAWSVGGAGGGGASAGGCAGGQGAFFSSSVGKRRSGLSMAQISGRLLGGGGGTPCCRIVGFASARHEKDQAEAWGPSPAANERVFRKPRSESGVFHAWNKRAGGTPAKLAADSTQWTRAVGRSQRRRLHMTRQQYVVGRGLVQGLALAGLVLLSGRSACARQVIAEVSPGSRLTMRRSVETRAA